MDNNGWLSTDFMIASVIIILTIPGIISIIEDRINTVNSFQEMIEAKILAENIAETIDMVYSGGSGCSIIFRMPPTISNKKYFLKINSSGVYIKLKGKMAYAYIPNLDISMNENIQANNVYNISNIQNTSNNKHIIIKRVN
jgi:C4-type Zn-finger protein